MMGVVGDVLAEDPFGLALAPNDEVVEAVLP